MRGIRYFTILCITLLSISNSHNCWSANNLDTKSRLHRWMTDIIDFLGREKFAHTGVSEETEQFVRAIQKEMGMEHWPIRILKMSKLGMAVFGKDNAFASFNTLVISEKLFSKLTEDEKRFLIGHELAHVKKNHCYKNILLAVALSSIAEGSGYLAKRLLDKFLTQHPPVLPNWLKKLLPKKIANAPLALLFFLIKFPIQRYSRIQEKEADTIAALELNTIKGGIALCERWKKKRDPYSRFTLWRLLYSHPSLDERIEYLKQLGTTKAGAMSS